MNNNVSEQIKNLRIEKGWTQAELGEKLGYSPQTISAWERGQNQPDIQALTALANVFQVTSDVLLGIEEKLQVTPPTLSEIEKRVTLTPNEIKPKAQNSLPSTQQTDYATVTDSYEKNCGASIALKILLFVYCGTIVESILFSLFGRGDFAFLILLLSPLALSFLDIAILIMFFIAKEKRYSPLFWVFIALLILSNGLSLIGSFKGLPTWLLVVSSVLSFACSLYFPFAFYPSNNEKPTFFNVIKCAKGYYVTFILYYLTNVTTAILDAYLLNFVLVYPLSFFLYFALYLATKNKKNKYFYTTTRHKETTEPTTYQSNIKSNLRLGSAYMRATQAEDERKRANAIPYTSAQNAYAFHSNNLAQEEIMVDKVVFPTKFILLILLITPLIMFTAGSIIYIPDNIPLFFSIILIFFSIIPTASVLCYFIFRQGSVKLRTTLCVVYTIFNVVLNLVFYEYEWNYYVPFPLVIIAIWGVGAVTIVQAFTLSDHKHLSIVARIATKVSFVFIEVIALSIFTWGYLTSDTYQIPIMLLTWWQLIFFAINCGLKAPLTKKVVNFIFK